MRHYVVIPKFDYSGAQWFGGTPLEQGYKVLPLPYLRRYNSSENEYYVYENETKYKAVEADSAASAIIASNIESPYKVVHAHVRIADVIEMQQLESVGKSADYMEKQGYFGETTEKYEEKPVNKVFKMVENIPEIAKEPKIASEQFEEAKPEKLFEITDEATKLNTEGMTAASIKQDNGLKH